MGARVAILITALCASGCAHQGSVAVMDLDTEWETGTVDPELLGDWYVSCGSEDLATLTFAEKDGAYAISSVIEKQNALVSLLPGDVARMLHVGRHRFLMYGCEEEVDGQKRFKGGFLQLCVIEDGVLTLSRPCSQSLLEGQRRRMVDATCHEFVDDDGEVYRMFGAFDRLDAKTLGFLSTLAEDPERWQTALVATRSMPDPM